MAQTNTPVPFLKWPGGKRKLADTIARFLLNDQTRRVVEPFCGSAAVSLSLTNRIDSFWLNDINPDLINLFECLRDRTDAVLAHTRALWSEGHNTPEVYYANRRRFNETTDPIEKAALFIYLNRHSYNGVVRYNSAGQFNVPFGSYRDPLLPEKAIWDAVTHLFSKALITQMDFEQVLDACGEGDAIYCDPPYIPLSKTASFTDYVADGFTMADQERLARAAERAALRGALVVISNHRTEASLKLYANASHIEELSVRRNISRDGASRGKAPELLAVYYPARPMVPTRRDE